MAIDRGEDVTLIEPMLIGESSRHRGLLTDLAIDLATGTAGLRHSLPLGVQLALADLMRLVNAYYNGLVSGRGPHPADIERARRGELSSHSERRARQLEARAQIDAQAWIDAGGLRHRATAAQGLCELHRRLCEPLPEEQLRVDDADTGESLEVIPGELRRSEAKVGRHVPVSPGAIPRFLAHLERSYARLGRTDAILATPAAHHRLLWIRPFLKGNGRVARWVSHAMLLETLDTGALWTPARGIWRNIGAYRALLAECDRPRRDAGGGASRLSEEALADFTRFFLETCLEEVGFMQALLEPQRLHARIQLWAEEEARLGRLAPMAGRLLDAVIRRGELPRGDAHTLLGATPRHARRIVASLIDRGVLASSGPRAPLQPAFPTELAPRWLPGLLPELPLG